MLSSDGEPVNNLVPVFYKNKKFDSIKAIAHGYSNNEIITLERAAEFGVDYVYFRHFPERPEVSLPQIYIYDFTEKEVSEDEITEKHRRLFSSVQVPMFFTFFKTEVKIFNCFKAPLKKDQLQFSPFKSIELAAKSSDFIKEFSAKKFDNGLFWENSEMATHFKFSGSAYERLLSELKTTLTKVLKEDILPPTLAKSLLVKSILIKYLEERKDEKGKTVFPKSGDIRLYKNGKSKKQKYEEDFFERFAKGATSFVDVLREKGASVELFKYLSRHFNGEIFKFEETDYERLRTTDLNAFADFIDTKVESGSRQTVLWSLYSFEDLPIELVSNVYEEFLDKKRGVVYTPPYLVNFLLDEVMPLSDTSTDFKILDPACGSGVFLVSAYKRLIYRWRAKNNWKKPNILTLQKLLSKNIFGVDEAAEAVNLAVFSLALALCDELSPITIWDELEFDTIKNKNVFYSDFFEVVHSETLSNDFDLVIGNPPFIPKFTVPAKEIETKRKRIIEWEGKTEKIGIPGNQLALLFLDQAIQFCKPTGQLCLILPATDFLYNYNSNKYRTWFFENHHVDQVVDFTNLSGCLFGNANVSVISLFAKNHLPENKESVSHITVRRNYLSEERLFFELDHYDFHDISFDLLDKNFVWKANLFGGGRLAKLLLRLSKLETLGEFLKEKKKDGWSYGEGFTVGNRADIEALLKFDNGELEIDNDKLNLLRKKFKKAAWLTGKKYLNIKSFSEKGLQLENLPIVKEKYFYRNCHSKKKIFENPHLMIRKVISNHSIPVLLSENYLTFDDRIVGIHAPIKEIQLLELIYKMFHQSKAYVFYSALISSKFAVTQNNTTAVVKRDFDSLPFPINNFDELRLSKIETIIQNDIISYWIDYSTGLKNGLKIFEPSSLKDLKNFGKLYCSQLNSTYDDFQAATPIFTDSFICYPFYIGEKPLIELPNKEELEAHLQNLIISENPSTNLRINRILRLYERNVIYLIKPKQLRYWLQSIAIRDADETFADLVAQEYQL